MLNEIRLMVRHLRNVANEHKNKCYGVGEIRVSDMAADCANAIDRLLAEVERLTNTNKMLEENKINAEMNLEHLTAEVERLNHQIKGMGANALIQEHIIANNRNPIEAEKMIKLILQNTGLQSEVEHLMAERNDAAVFYTEQTKKQAKEIEQLRAERDTANRERDAAVGDMNDIAKKSGACRDCEHEFEWRGIPEVTP